MKSISLFIVAFFTLTISVAQTAEEIINKHLDAIGGIANLKKVNSFVQKASVLTDGMEIQITNTILDNYAAKMEISLMGESIYQIVTKTEGWNYNPFQGDTTAEAMTQEELLESQTKLDAENDLIDYKAKGHDVILLGKEKVDGVECFKLEFARKGKSPDVIFIHPSSYYIIQQIKILKTNGKEDEVVTKFSDFKKHSSGIVYPMLYEGTPFGPETQMVIESIEVNSKIDPELFKPSN